jgi:predicted enzyme related to lactoylglutathione lyase
MPSSQGRFVWHDLATSNADAAMSFYTQVTPWKTQQGDYDPNYTMWVNGAHPLGGVEALSDELKARGIAPQWLPYVSVYDVDDCTRQVAALGGQVRMGPYEVPNVGCWSVITDPQGARIGLYEPEAAAQHENGAPRRGEFSWHELGTTDYKAAFEFYRTLFGWEKTSEFDMGDMGIYFMFGKKGVPYGGMFNRRPEMPPPNWLSYIRVEDVRGTADMVKKLGGAVHQGPMEVPGGDMIAMCSDPQGATIAFHTPSATG